MNRFESQFRAGPAPLTPPPPPAPWQERFKNRWWIYARWLLVGLPLAVVGLILGVGLYVFTHSGTFTGNEVIERPGIRSFSWPLHLNRRVNVLLIGVDVTLNNRRQVVNVSRSDTLMLISVDPEHRRINALSIPRDTRAEIPGVGANKINAAYAFGGPGLTIRSVEGLLGVPVHYYVKLGPDSFARIIDALGGVEIDVEKDMKYTDHWASLYIDLKKGRQWLDGDEAMQYIRFRHDALGDIGRVERQQKVLMAILQKLTSPSTVLRAPRLLRALVERTQTNLTMRELLTLGLFAARLSAPDIHTATLPGQVGPVYISPDVAKAGPLIAEMFFGVDARTLSSTAVEVINASGIPGLGRQTAARLERFGVRIVRVDSVTTLARVTTIIDRSGRPEVARLLAEVLGQKPITHEPGSGPDITILVARDLAVGLHHPAVAKIKH